MAFNCFKDISVRKSYWVDISRTSVCDDMTRLFLSFYKPFNISSLIQELKASPELELFQQAFRQRFVFWWTFVFVIRFWGFLLIEPVSRASRATRHESEVMISEWEWERHGSTRLAQLVPCLLESLILFFLISKNNIWMSKCFLVPNEQRASLIIANWEE